MFDFINFEEINLKELAKNLRASHGSARKVYVVGNYAIKVAKNKKGIAQNEVEAGVYQTHELFNKVHYVSPNFSYLVVDRATKIRNMGTVARHFDDDMESVCDEVEMSTGVLANDLNKPSSWGMVNGKPKIIDYGFDEDVMMAHYS